MSKPSYRDPKWALMVRLMQKERLKSPQKSLIIENQAFRVIWAILAKTAILVILASHFRAREGADDATKGDDDDTHITFGDVAIDVPTVEVRRSNLPLVRVRLALLGDALQREVDLEQLARALDVEVDTSTSNAHSPRMTHDPCTGCRNATPGRNSLGLGAMCRFWPTVGISTGCGVTSPPPAVVTASLCWRDTHT